MAKNLFDSEVFSWSGVNKSGSTVKGLLPAENSGHAEAQLAAIGITVNHVQKKAKWLVQGQLKEPKMDEILIFMRQLATMLGAGIPLAQGIEIISTGVEKFGMKIMLQKIHKEISSGVSFSDALAKFPNQFNSLMLSLVQAGEKTGNLDAILDQIASYLERMAALKARVRKAMFYPGIMLVVTLAVAALLLGFIVPQFDGMFKSFGAELPAATQMVVLFSNILQEYYWLIGLILIGAIVAIIMLKKRSEKFAYFLDALMVRMVLFGPLVQKAILARATRTLSVTLASGIPLVDSLQNIAAVANNRVYANAILRVRDDVVTGRQMNTAMVAQDIFPPMMIQMIAVGEKTGEMEHMLTKVSEFYDEEVTNMVDGLSTLIEPIMLVILGTIIGGFVISMYLPIFQLGTIL